MVDTLPGQETASASCPAKRCWLLPILGVCTLAAFAVAAYYRTVSDGPLAPPLLSADAKSLKSTVVTAHLDAPITPGKNVLWCSTFQLVWNAMCDQAGGDLHLKDEPPMVASLNKKAATKDDVDANSCLVMSGKIEDGIVAKIRKALDGEFYGQANPELLDRIESQLPAEGYLAYTYLFRQLPFDL
jgi:hypothetical protein